MCFPTVSRYPAAALLIALVSLAVPHRAEAQFWKKIAGGVAKHAAERAVEHATQAESTAVHTGTAAVDSAYAKGGEVVVRTASSIGARRAELRQVTLLVAAGDTTAFRQLERIQDEMLRRDSLAAVARP